MSMGSLHRAMLLTVVLLPCCGTRTGLSQWEQPEGTGGSGGGDGAVGGSGGSGAFDDCPSAIAGPRAMFGSCSTRDGRTRVAAPFQPQLRWSASLATQDDTRLDVLALATDDAGHAYVVTRARNSLDGNLKKVFTNDGTIGWSIPLATSAATDAVPVLMQTRDAVVYAYGEEGRETVLEVDMDSGAATESTFGFDLYYAPGNPAVGADGSLYVTHSTGVGTSQSTTYVSRVLPGGAVAWTTALRPTGPQTLTISPIALHEEEVYVVATSVPSSFLLVLDAATGTELDSDEGTRTLLGGPAVRRDGSVVMLVGGDAQGPPELVVRAGGESSRLSLDQDMNSILCVTREGGVIGTVTAGPNGGFGGIVGLNADGTTRWRKNIADVRDGQLANNGLVVIHKPDEILGLEQDTGEIVWRLRPPSDDSFLGDVALTPEGGLVGIDTDAEESDATATFQSQSQSQSRSATATATATATFRFRRRRRRGRRRGR